MKISTPMLATGICNRNRTKGQVYRTHTVRWSGRGGFFYLVLEAPRECKTFSSLAHSTAAESQLLSLGFRFLFGPWSSAAVLIKAGIERPTLKATRGEI